jgi:hypothetical protein
MKTYGGVEVHTHVFLTSALVGGEWSKYHKPSYRITIYLILYSVSNNAKI